MRWCRIFFVACIFNILLWSGCSNNREPSASEKAKLAAIVTDWQLTREEVEKVVDLLPDHQKAKYDSQTGRAELVNLMIEEELYYQDAEKIGLEDDKLVKDKIQESIRRVLITEYYIRYVTAKAKPTDEEMHDYYESDPDRFSTRQVVKAQHIFSKNREKLVEFKKRIENGEKMTTLAHKFSEDKITRADGGDLGYFNPGGYIRFVGYSKKFNDAVFALEPGVVSDPIEFEKGYSIVRVNEQKPARLKPYEEVKSQISSMLTNRRIDAVKEQVVAELKKKYEVLNYLEEEMQLTQRLPEELWSLAQTSTDSYQRVRAYKEIYEKFPDNDYAPQALFMAGFVYAEELKDQYSASKAFSTVLLEYPGTDIAKSAKWMLSNLGKPLPDFEDLDDLNKKISEKSK